MSEHIDSLRRQRAEHVATVTKLAAQEAEHGVLAEADLKAFDGAKDAIATLDAQIQRAEEAEALAAQHAEPVASKGMPAIHTSKPEPKQYPGATFARTAMAIAAGGGNLQEAAKFAETELNDKQVAAAVSTAAGSGGALIPENVHNEVIELLRPVSVVRGLNPRLVPLFNGNLKMPKMTGGAVSHYVDENTDSKSSDPSVGDIELSAKTNITMVPISNQLIGRGGFNVEQMFLSDMIAALGSREDAAFLRGDGANNTPTGMKSVATTASRTVAWAGTADVATIDAYLDSLMLKLMESDSMMVRPAWIVSPRTYMKLYGLRDGNGNKVYPEMAQGMLKGFPIAKTNNVPSNLGSATDESEIYFADFNDVVVGDEPAMTVDFSREASYKDAAGNLHSSFSKNQSLIRLVTGADIGFRHTEGLVMGTGVKF